MIAYAWIFLDKEDTKFENIGFLKGKTNNNKSTKCNYVEFAILLSSAKDFSQKNM